MKSYRFGFTRRLFDQAKGMRRAVTAVAIALLGSFGPLHAQETGGKPPTGVADRLYTLDCGLTEFQDASAFSDTGEYDGRSVALPTPCYLVRHGKDWLLWDTGNGDRLASMPDGETKFGGRFSQRRTLAGQLAALGLKPDDIRYVALSHIHQDHSGNIGLFPKATFLVAASELAWARGTPTPFGVEAASVALLGKVRVEPLDEDKDVFGDGSIKIIKAPGHTPGGRSLFVRLAKAGSLLVTGDLYHTRENYEKGLVPSPNVDRAQTLASFDRFKRIAANTKARVIVQHAPEDFAALPAFPKYLD
ncbi:N-acyl homoserine lactonase family protein [Sphingomonas paucimobilis]|jgi:N-acyl homoserine lactone hydrolase|uniref:N-acyl homoserine lactonase family protein n=1 Tax=Sphingomonas paucimobilis TaxID=13689 RepID=A0A7T3AEM9_SPHPI|nr:N-acyl homoserine lactonase family protein [Sphingomonas paucimobilis]QPT11220.1 N-acyl homoserine lactonase family protein [Sphingomonas paucimobilis]